MSLKGVVFFLVVFTRNNSLPSVKMNHNEDGKREKKHQHIV